MVCSAYLFPHSKGSKCQSMTLSGLSHSEGPGIDTQTPPQYQQINLLTILGLFSRIAEKAEIVAFFVDAVAGCDAMVFQNFPPLSGG